MKIADVAELLERLKDVKDDSYAGIVKEKTLEMGTEVISYFREHNPKLLPKKFRSGNLEEVKISSKTSKLAEQVYAVRKRLKRLTAGNYRDLHDKIEIKLSRVVDSLKSTLGKGKKEEFEAYKSRMRIVFEGDGSEFNLKGIRSNFDDFIFLLVDELGMEER